MFNMLRTYYIIMCVHIYVYTDREMWVYVYMHKYTALLKEHI